MKAILLWILAGTGLLGCLIIPMLYFLGTIATFSAYSTALLFSSLVWFGFAGAATWYGPAKRRE